MTPRTSATNPDRPRPALMCPEGPRHNAGVVHLSTSVVLIALISGCGDENAYVAPRRLM